MFTRILLTLKQHRFEVISVSLVCFLVTLGCLIEAFRLNSVHVPAACLYGGGHVGWYSGNQSYPCAAISMQFQDIAQSADVQLLVPLGRILPFFVGIALGAPLVAKELEEGTAPLSWALSGSRRRWLLGKLLAACVLLVPLMLAVGLATDVLHGAMVPGVDAHASFEDFSARGIMLVFWGLAALTGTVALGALFARTMPAVMVGLVVCVLARGMWEPVMNRTLLAPLAVLRLPDADYSSADLFVREGPLYLDGKPWAGDLQAWWDSHTTCTSDGTTTSCGVSTSEMAPMNSSYIIHSDLLWPVMALESGVLLAGSLVCAGIALVWVDRRRPY
jgi:hypothetical protein